MRPQANYSKSTGLAVIPQKCKSPRGYGKKHEGKIKVLPAAKAVGSGEKQGQSTHPAIAGYRN